MFSGVHNMCKILPNSLKTQELNCKSQSQRWSGGVQNFPSVADGRYVHTSRCWKRKRGKSAHFRAAKKLQRVGLDFMLIWTISSNLNQHAQWKVTVSDCVGGKADGGSACTSTREFRSEGQASSGGTWFLFGDHWRSLRWLSFSNKCLNKIH